MKTNIKIIVLILFTAIITSCSTDNNEPSGPSYTDEAFFTYETSGSPTTVTITGLSQLWEDSTLNTKYSISIPNTIEGYSVTEIKSNAFEGQTTITDVTIPESVTYIGIYAFRNCTSLSNISIPDSMTSINRFVFFGCTSLASIDIPNSVTSIGDLAFQNCTSLASINIPDSVTSIGGNAFQNCTSLVSIDIPDSVTFIGNYTFFKCTGLTSVTIPSSVTSIGFAAFAECSSLTLITVPASNPNYSTTDGVLYNKETTTLISYPAGRSDAFTIPSSVTSIDDYAFYGCTGLTSVTIPNSVTSIGSYAFTSSSNLSSVVMNPISPPVIDTSATPFIDCLALTASNAIKVPVASLTAYKTADGWSNYANIIGAQ